jgi:hypothetical protein
VVIKPLLEGVVDILIWLGLIHGICVLRI